MNILPLDLGQGPSQLEAGQGLTSEQRSHSATSPALTLLRSALASQARRCTSVPCFLWIQLSGPMATHSHLSQPLCWFCPSLPLSLGFRIPRLLPRL